MPIKFGMAVLAVVFCGCHLALSQQNGTKPPEHLTMDDFPRTRDINSGDTVFEFKKKKPTFQHKRTVPRVKRIPAKAIAPAKTNSKLPADPNPAEEWKQVGGTIWRLPNGKIDNSGGEAGTIVVKTRGQTQELTPQRVAADGVFKLGDKVRLSFESPTTGYLYVFDREIYADGTVGEPYQTFPTMAARRGDNRVEAGSVIDIPGQSDASPFFVLSSANPKWRGELLTVIVSPEQLADMGTPKAPSPTSAAMVAALENKYLKTAEEYEQDGTVGKNYTKIEKEAGAVGTRQLTQGDPYPQTLYRVKARAKEPLLINLSLSVK